MTTRLRSRCSSPKLPYRCDLMDRFPKDGPKASVVAALSLLGFRIVREREHIALERLNPDGSKTPLTMPNHRTIKGPTLRAICQQAGISREDFLRAYQSGERNKRRRGRQTLAPKADEDG